MMTAIIKAVLQFLFKSVIQAALASILQAEIKEYWKKNKQKLIRKHVLPHLPKLLKARAALQSFSKRMSGAWQRIRSIGKGKKAPKEKARNEPAKPPAAERNAKKTPLVSDEDPTVTEFAGMVYRGARDRAASLLRRGKGILSKGKEDAQAPKTDATPEPSAPNKPAAPPDAQQERKPAPPPPPQPERPEEPEESTAEWVARLERTYGRKAKEREAGDRDESEK